MNIEDKKTALSDDSILYQKRDEAQNRKNVKELDFNGKVQYFKDYHLTKVLVGLFIVIVCGSLIYQTFFHRESTLATLNCIGETFIADNEKLGEDLKSLLYPDAGSRAYVYINNYNLEDYNMQIAFTTHTVAGNVDLILCDEEQFKRHAERDMFADLSTVLDKDTYDAVSSSIVEGQVAEFDENSDIISYYDPYPMAVDISGNKILSEYGAEGDTWYLCICSNTERLEDTLTLFRFLTSAEAAQE